MKALRSSPFLPVASALHFFIFSCCVIGAAAAVAVPPDRQLFMKALRASPFLSPASLLQSPIFDCCLVMGALAAMSGACLCEAANAEVETARATAAASMIDCFKKVLPVGG